MRETREAVRGKIFNERQRFGIKSVLMDLIITEISLVVMLIYTNIDHSPASKYGRTLESYMKPRTNDASRNLGHEDQNAFETHSNSDGS